VDRIKTNILIYKIGTQL